MHRTWTPSLFSSRSFLRLCGMSLLIHVNTPPLVDVLSCLYTEYQFGLQLASGKLASSLLSQIVKTSSKSFLKTSDICMYLHLELFIFRYPIMRFLSFFILSCFNSYKESLWWYGSHYLPLFSVWLLLLVLTIHISLWSVKALCVNPCFICLSIWAIIKSQIWCILTFLYSIVISQCSTPTIHGWRESVVVAALPSLPAS